PHSQPPPATPPLKKIFSITIPIGPGMKSETLRPKGLMVLRSPSIASSTLSIAMSDTTFLTASRRLRTCSTDHDPVPCPVTLMTDVPSTTYETEVDTAPVAQFHERETPSRATCFTSSVPTSTTFRKMSHGDVPSGSVTAIGSLRTYGYPLMFWGLSTPALTGSLLRNRPVAVS